MNIDTHKETLRINKFCFQHDIGKCQTGQEDNEPSYLFSGHIHPGIQISGVGRQVLKFPCFYFTDEFCVLPAFSKFTGVALIEPKKGEVVFAIVDNALIHCN